MKIEKYKKLKNKGLISIQKLVVPSPQGDVLLIAKRFDHESGEEMSPEVVPVFTSQIVELKDNAQQAVNSLQELIDDINQA